MSVHGTMALKMYHYTTVSSRLCSTPSSHVRTVSSGSENSSLSVELKFQHISSIYFLLGFISVHVSDIKSDYSSHMCEPAVRTHWHTYTHTEAKRERARERERERERGGQTVMLNLMDSIPIYDISLQGKENNSMFLSFQLE